jgi:hypothetical protein
MKERELNDEDAAALDERIDRLGWGVLFIAVGAVGLVPGLPENAWLIATGVVMLGACVVRAQLGLPVHGLTMVTGTVALAAGISSAVGLSTATGPIVLAVLGLALIIAALYRPERLTERGPVAQRN